MATALAAPPIALEVARANEALTLARQAQKAAADHIRFCSTPYEHCIWCQWHERNVSALYARADAQAERAALVGGPS